MKPSLLPMLECPRCRSGYALHADEVEGEEVMQGRLDCACGVFEIRGGVPRLLPEDVHPKNWRTARRFGEEWNQFSKITPEHMDQFLSWIEPVTESHFPGKTVLDLGCGKGRHVLQANRFGAKTIVGVDLSHAVDAAFRNVGRLAGVHIIQADIFNLPLKPVFDYAYSIGVLHHTPHPKQAFLCMVDKVRPGGTLSAWVYGREGNGWIIWLVDPVRWVTARLWLPLTKALAFVLAVVLQALLKGLYAPAAERPALRRLLPYADYLCSISGYGFSENFSIVFDHLLPAIAYYVRREEFADWFETGNLQDVTITRRYANSWRGFARKPVTPAPPAPSAAPTTRSRAGSPRP